MRLRHSCFTVNFAKYFQTQLLPILTLSWQRFLSYRNQSIDWQIESRDWFLYDRDLRYECVNWYNWQIIFTTEQKIVNYNFLSKGWDKVGKFGGLEGQQQYRFLSAMQVEIMANTTPTLFVIITIVILNFTSFCVFVSAFSSKMVTTYVRILYHQDEMPRTCVARALDVMRDIAYLPIKHLNGRFLGQI